MLLVYARLQISRKEYECILNWVFSSTLDGVIFDHALSGVQTDLKTFFLILHRKYEYDVIVGVGITSLLVFAQSLSSQDNTQPIIPNTIPNILLRL